MIATLKVDMDRERAKVGLYITLNRPTRLMTQEDAPTGIYGLEHSQDHRYPPLQILTIKELLDGTHAEFPHFAPRSRTDDALQPPNPISPEGNGRTLHNSDRANLTPPCLKAIAPEVHHYSSDIDTGPGSQHHGQVNSHIAERGNLVASRGILTTSHDPQCDGMGRTTGPGRHAS